MRLLITLLAAALPSMGFSSDQSDRFVWHDKQRTITFSSGQPDGFWLATSDGKKYKCVITHWPISEPEGIMSCDDLKDYRFGIIDDNSIQFGDKILSKR